MTIIKSNGRGTVYIRSGIPKDDYDIDEIELNRMNVAKTS